MSVLDRWWSRLLVGGLAVTLQPLASLAQTNAPTPTSATAPSAPAEAGIRDGQGDFDFEIGTWRTHLRRLVGPLTGSTTWVEYEGTSIVRKVWDGRANLVELSVAGPAGQIEGLSLRLYDPVARQWSLHFANSRTGALFPPVIGGFTDGRGEFYGQEIIAGRVVYVRFVIAPITPVSWRFEQAFSADGGKTWEVNWIATDTRVGESAVVGP
jgi:hypothetical protein